MAPAEKHNQTCLAQELAESHCGGHFSISAELRLQRLEQGCLYKKCCRGLVTALLSRGTKPSEQEQGSKDKTIILFVVSLAKQLGREWEEREQLLPSLQGSSSNTGSSCTQHMAGSDAMQQQRVSSL